MRMQSPHPSRLFLNHCHSVPLRFTSSGGEHGICSTALNACMCYDGWNGDLCSQPPANSCDNVSCENEGICIGGTCECSGGYTGQSCQTAPSTPEEEPDPCASVNCGSHGTCSADGDCVCSSGWSGNACSTDLSCDNNDCSGHGNCHGGTCSCFLGFKPVNPTEPIDCSMMENGRLVSEAFNEEATSTYGYDPENEARKFQFTLGSFQIIIITIMVFGAVVCSSGLADMPKEPVRSGCA